MNTSNGPAQVKKQEDSDESPGKSSQKLDAKPAARILNRVPRTYISQIFFSRVRDLTLPLGACVCSISISRGRYLADFPFASVECLPEAKNEVRGCREPTLSTMQTRRPRLPV
jgi:hypothetical protein